MTDKEFRRLSRADLVEIIYELQKREKTLQDENEDLKRQLEDRQIAVSEAGSLAEVLAKLNGLFEAAQSTADGYREDAARALEEARQTREKADEYMSAVKQQAIKLATVTTQQRKEMLAKTEEECRQMRAAAQTGQRPQQSRQGGGDLNRSAAPGSAKEGRYDVRNE